MVLEEKFNEIVCISSEGGDKTGEEGQEGELELEREKITSDSITNDEASFSEFSSTTTNSTLSSTSSSSSSFDPPSPLEKDDPNELVSRLLQELHQLRRDKRRLQGDLERTGKSVLNAEIEELTRTLFEEANGMVAVEAQRAWALEQTQLRLESELAKTREQLVLEAQQTRLLRDIVEQDRDSQKCQDPVLWDVDVFGARLVGAYTDDFFPQRAFDSRHCATASHWELLGTRTVQSTAFRRFSEFVDDCFRLTTRLQTSKQQQQQQQTQTQQTQTQNPHVALLDDQIVLETLSHSFVKTCLLGDIEPCLAFPVLERTGKTRSFLKRLLPAMLKNNCIIEPLPNSPSSTASSYTTSTCNSPARATESTRSSPLSIRSFITLKTSRRSESPTPLASTNANASPINIANNSQFLIDDTNSSFFGSSPTSITSIESCPVSPTESAAMLKCSMCEASGKDSHSPSNIPLPTHRFKITTTSNASSSYDHWNLVCKHCRDRLVSVASFFTLIRHLLQGLHAHRPKLDIFFDLMQAKRFMFYTRAGVDMEFFALSDFEAFSNKIH
jgi:hypothetical protein